MSDTQSELVRVNYATGKKDGKDPKGRSWGIGWIVGKPNEDDTDAQREADIQASRAPDGVKMDRNKFINQESTGIILNEKGQRAEGLQSNEIELSQNLITQYKNFLKGYLKNLNDLRGTESTFDNTVIANINHAHDRKIYDQITKENSIKLDNSPAMEMSMDAWLSREENIILLQELIDHQTELKMLALGLQSSLSPEGKRVTVAEEETIKLGVDQGTLNQIWDDKIYPKIKDFFYVSTAGRTMPDEKTLKTTFKNIIANSMSAMGIGTIVALLTHNALLTYGTDTAAFLALNKGINSIISDGLTLEMQHSGDMLDVMQSNAAEAKYMRAMMGIDVRDFTHTPGQNDIRLAPGRDPHTTGITQLRDEIISGILTRQQYHAEIGIPLELTDASPLQSIGKNLRSREQIRTRANLRQQEIYYDIEAIQIARRRQQGQELTTADRIDIRTRAQVDYMNELIEKEVSQKAVKEDEEKENQLSEDLAKRMESRKSSTGTRRSEEMARLREQQASLVSVSAILTQESEQLRTLLENNNEVEKAKTALEKKLAELGLTNLGADLEDSVKQALNKIDNYLQYNNPDVFTGTMKLNIKGQLVGVHSIDHQIHTAIGLTETKIHDLESDQTYINLKSQLEDAIVVSQSSDARIQNSDRQIAEKIAQRDRITDQSTPEYSQAGQELGVLLGFHGQLLQDKLAADRSIMPLRTRLAPLENEIKKYRSDLETQKNAPEKDPKTMNAAKLRAVIQVELNSLNQLYTTFTTETENAKTRLQNDKDILSAKQNSTEYTKQHTLLTGITTDATHIIPGGLPPAGLPFPGISTDDLVNLSLIEIMDRVSTAHTAVDPANNNPNPIDNTWSATENDLQSHKNQIIHAQVEARAMKIAAGATFTEQHRLDAMKQYQEQLQLELERLKGKGPTDAIDRALSTEVQQIDRAIALNDRRVEMKNGNSGVNNLMEVTLHEPGINLEVPENTKGFTPQERETINGVDFAHEPKLYFELLNLLTGYQKHDKRGKEFTRWAELVPPARMLQAINDVVIRPPHAAIPDLGQQAVNKLNSLYKHGALGSDTMRSVLYNIIKSEVDQAMALEV